MLDYNNVNFQPAPIEEAYGMYILQHVFQLNVNDTITFRVPGRDAVPFLKQSGLQRDILRTIWSTVDPESTGRLTTPNQFYIILRLIAITQQGAFTNITSEPTIDMMLQYLIQYNCNQLAVFNDYPIPDQNTLETIYYQNKNNNSNYGVMPSVSPSGMAVETSSGSMSSTTGGGEQSNYNSANNYQADATSMLATQNNDAFGQQQQTTPQQLSTIEDAFGGLVEVQDAPMPTLTSMMNNNPESTTTTTTTTTAESIIDNNSTELPPPTPLDQPVVSSSSTNISATDTTSSQIIDPFAAGTGGTAAAATASTVHHHTPPIDTTTLRGDFSVTTTPHSNEQPPINNFNATSDDNFGDFNTTTTTTQLPVIENNNINAYDNTNQQNNNNNMGDGGMMTINTTVPNNVNDHDFGDFTATTSALPINDFNNNNQTNQQDTNNFGTMPATSGNWDAFDALATDVQDAPLPTLTPLGSTAEVSTGSNNNEQQQSSLEGKTNFENDTLDNVGSNLTPAQTDISHQQPSDDLFGGFNSTISNDVLTAPAPTDTMNTNNVAAVAVANVSDDEHDDDFGDFEGTTSQPVQNNNEIIEQPVVATTGAWDAFDSLAGGSQDAPLPPLQSMVTETTTSPIESNGNLEFTQESDNNIPVETPTANDDEHAGTTTAAAPIITQSEDTDDEFGDFVSTDDESIEKEGRKDVPAVTSSVPDVFQGFQTTTEPNNVNGLASSGTEPVVPISQGAWDAFDSLGGSQDAPLPPLQSMATDDVVASPSKSNEQGDSLFTQSEDNNMQPVDTQFSNNDEQIRTSAPVITQTEDVDDEFGDFVSTDDESIGKKDVPATSVPDAFEGFQTSTTEPNVNGLASGGTGWDAFDALSNVVQDTPLPSLDAFGSKGPDSSTEITGDKVGHVPVEPTEGATSSQTNDLVPEPDSFPNVNEAPKPDGPSTSGWDAFDALGETNDAPLQGIVSHSVDQQHVVATEVGQNSVDADKGIQTGNELVQNEEGQTKNEASSAIQNGNDQDESEEFGDFGDFEMHSGNDKSDESSPFDILATPADQPLQSLTQPADKERVDSSFYSAESKSTCSDGVEDLGGFADAAQSVETGDPNVSPRVDGSFPVTSQDGVTNKSVGDDPFSVFDSVSSPPVVLPGTQPIGADFIGSGDTNVHQSSDQKIESSEPTVAITPQDDFGDFSGFEQPSSSAQELTEPSNEIDREDEGGKEPADRAVVAPTDDSFGDFAGFAGADFTSPEIGNQTESAATHTGGNEDSFDNFSAFDGPKVIPDATTDTSLMPSAVKDQNGIPEESTGFGDFSGFEASNDYIPNHSNEKTDAELNTDFGDFNGLHNEVAQANTQEDDDFGDFEAVKSSPDAITAEATGDDFGDFASFTGGETKEETNDISTTQPIPEADNRDASTGDELTEQKDEIIDKSFELPEALRRKSGKGGKFVNFGDCFDANIGTETPLSSERKARISRCLHLMTLLSSTHMKLVTTYWTQCIAVANTEMAKSLSIFEEARNLSKEELIFAKTPLKTYFLALGEFVRVTRGITATIGDLLMLEKSALLTIDTLNSSWCSISFVEDALEVETLWKKIEQVCLELGVKRSETESLESICEMRSVIPVKNDNLCYFTLQPVRIESSQNHTTKNNVIWHDKQFMACAANFLANKCSFYSVN